MAGCSGDAASLPQFRLDVADHAQPKVSVDAVKVAALRAQGQSWSKIARELGVSVGTVYQAAGSLSKKLSAPAAANDLFDVAAGEAFRLSRIG